MSKFVIRAGTAGVKFDLKADNGQTIAVSEVYDSRAACLRGVESVRKNAPIAKVEDQTADGCKKCTNPKFEVFTDRAGQYRFRLKARNGLVIAASEGYTSKAACLKSVQSVQSCAVSAELTEE